MIFIQRNQLPDQQLPDLAAGVVMSSLFYPFVTGSSGSSQVSALAPCSGAVGHRTYRFLRFAIAYTHQKISAPAAPHIASPQGRASSSVPGIASIFVIGILFCRQGLLFRSFTNYRSLNCYLPLKQTAIIQKYYEGPAPSRWF